MSDIDETTVESEELTVDTVKSNISHGWFVVKFDNSKGASTAFDVMQKIYYREVDGGEQLKNWYHCSRCGHVFSHDTSTGSAPLVRHKEKCCPKLTTEEKQKFAEEHKEKKVRAGAKKVVTKPIVSESTQQKNDVFDLIAKCTEIGRLYGPVSVDSLQEASLDTDKW